MDALSPPCAVTKVESCTMSRMAAHSGSEMVSVGSMFDLIVLPSGRKTHSCGTAIMRERRVVRFIVSMSVLSIVKVRPGVGVGSRRRRIKRMREDFPLVNISGGIVESGMGGDVYLPVRPQTAIFSPELIVSEMFFRARAAPSASGVSIELHSISVFRYSMWRLPSYLCDADTFLSTMEPLCGHSAGGLKSSPG